MTDDTLQKHFNLLQIEYQKLNLKYQTLKQKHNDVLFLSNSLSQEDTFLTNLLKTIKSLYKDKKYSDISINLQKATIPGHKLVLEAHCGEWGASDLYYLNEINLQDVEQSIGEQVVRWLYTQEIKDNQNSDDLWKIVEIAHNFSLIHLKSRCQDNLLSKVSTDNCIYFYMKSCELGVENLQRYCMNFIVANWNDHKADDFCSLSAGILLELFEAQSNFPLHTAVKYGRDDVVFVFINDNFTRLEEVVNTVSDCNEIVLDLALISKRMELCQTLRNNCANINIADTDGWSLLHRAVHRRDEFAARFLIENGCHLNPLSPDLMQTPLQLIARLKPCNEDPQLLENMNRIAVLLVNFGANVSHSDSNDMTAVCLAVLSGNETVLQVILESGRCNSINGIDTYCLSRSKSLSSSPRGSRNTLTGLVPPQPLWLAVCREYRQELLYKYSDFSGESVMRTSPTLRLLEHGADPGCINDLDFGNSIFLEIISRQMEEAAIFILKNVQQKSLCSTSCSSDKKLSIETLLTLTNNCKETALHMAVDNEMIRLCSLLLSLGADPNAIRRRLVQNSMSNGTDDSCGSMESINSLSSNNPAEESTKRDSQDSGSRHSSSSSRFIDSNPFKEFMQPDSEIDHVALTFSLPAVSKQTQCRSSLFESLLTKNQQREYSSYNIKRTKCRTKSKKVTPIDVSVDLCSPTHLAMRSRNVALIAVFIEHNDSAGHSVNWLLCDWSGESAFTLSLWSGLVTVTDKIFGKMTQKGIKASKIDEISVEGNRLLHLAVLKNNIEAVQFLIKIGCSINIRSSNGETPLQLAIDRCNIDIVRILCLAGADPNVSYEWNVSDLNKSLVCPLWAALSLHRFAIAEILAESGSEVDMWFVDPRDNYDQTLLHRAIFERNEEAAIFLISHDCDVNSPRQSRISQQSSIYRESELKYIDGSTPLHVACQFGLVETVRHLLSKSDIMVDAQNAQGCTALHLAILYQQSAVLSLLLDRTVKLNLSLRDKQGHTAFHVAMEMSNQIVASTILELEPNAANEVDNMGRNFLHVAVQTMNREAMFFLIQINVNLNIRVEDCLQHTPLQLAIITGVPEDMVRSLILAGARVEDETVEKHNLLHLAVIHERTYLINCLVENGASISHQDHNLDTPLHLAMKFGNKDVIEQLLKKSAKCIRMKNLKGETVLHVLANNAKDNDVSIFSLLLDIFNDFPLNELDAAGNTVLFLSVLHERARLAVAVLRKGASLGCINNDGVSLFNCNQLSEPILLKLLDSLESEPMWLDGEMCVSCLCKFTIKNRKHHCRHCGRLVCGKCSNNEIPIVRFGITKPVRVCDTCFNFMVNGKLK